MASSRRLLAAALLALATRGVAALTLGDAVESALERQPGMELEDARAAEGGAIARQAESLFAADPSVGFMHYNDGIGSGDGGREWEAGVAMPLWLPGQRSARQGVAAAAARQAQGSAVERAWVVAGEVRTRLWDVAAAEQRRNHLGAALADARKLEESVQRRMAAGDLARPDLLLARREALIRAAEMAEAESALQLARTRWHAYTGLHDLPPFEPESEAGVHDGIDADHPGLVLQAAAMGRAAAERDRVRSDRRSNPVLTLGGRHERGSRDEPWNDAIAVGLDVPLGMPSQGAPALGAAEVAYTEAAVAYQRTRLTLEERVAVARTELEGARAALALLRDAQVAAEAALERAQAAFDLGEETLITLLQVRGQALDTAMRFGEMQTRVARGIAALNQASGQLPR